MLGWVLSDGREPRFFFGIQDNTNPNGPNRALACERQSLTGAAISSAPEEPNVYGKE
jgi:hypothetical protein